MGKGHAVVVFIYVCVYSQLEVARRCSCNAERKENSGKKNKEDECDFLLTAYKSSPSRGGQEKAERSELIETRIFFMKINMSSKIYSSKISLEEK